MGLDDFYSNERIHTAIWMVAKRIGTLPGCDHLGNQRLQFPRTPGWRGPWNIGFSALLTLHESPGYSSNFKSTGRLIFLPFDGDLLTGFAIEIYLFAALFLEKLIPRKVLLNLVVGHNRTFSGLSCLIRVLFRRMWWASATARSSERSLRGPRRLCSCPGKAGFPFCSKIFPSSEVFRGGGYASMMWPA
jgi:hypothetical protein